jgi:hypothetical protein
MPAPLLAPLLATAAQAGYQYFQGRKQKKMANELEPSNYVPPSLKEAVRSSRMEANATTIPGFGRTMEKLRTSTANTVARTTRGTTDSNRIQQSVADADAREKEVIKDLGVANENFRLQSGQRLRGMLGIQAGNERASYDAYVAAKSALTGASMANQYNAFSGLTENLLGLYALEKYGGEGGSADGNFLSSLFGGMSSKMNEKRNTKGIAKSISSNPGQMIYKDTRGQYV